MSAISNASHAYETRIAEALRGYGLKDAERRVVKHPDRGDITGVPDWTLELKGIAPGNGSRCETCRQPRGRFDMAAAMDQAARARMITGTPYFGVIRQRKSVPAARQYVIIELEPFAGILRRLDEV